MPPKAGANIEDFFWLHNLNSKKNNVAVQKKMKFIKNKGRSNYQFFLRVMD